MHKNRKENLHVKIGCIKQRFTDRKGGRTYENCDYPEEIIQPDITAEELISKWKELEAIPGGRQVYSCRLWTPTRPWKNWMRLVEDVDALFGVWITEGLMSEAFFKSTRS